MIIGRGLIASLFTDTDSEDVLFFASGVSNSLETDPAQFAREKALVEKTLTEHPEKLFIYFSTCSIYDSSKTNSPYVLHKLAMEALISAQSERCLILRVSNAVGRGGNPNLLMNYLHRAIHRGETIDVHTKATRNLVDAADVRSLTLEFIARKKTNTIINLAYMSQYSIIEVLEIMENYYQLPLNLNLLKSGSGYDIHAPEAEEYFKQNQLNNKEFYLCRMLENYYPKTN